MKPLITLLSFGLTWSATAQVTISGTFVNAPIGSEVAITHYNNTIEWDEVSIAKAKVDEQGRFSATFPWDKAGPAQMQLADQYTKLFLTPGDSLHFTCDYANFDSTLHYTGRGSVPNNYMAADVLAAFDQKAVQSIAQFDNADHFVYVMDSLEQMNRELLQSYDTPEWSAEFRQYITASTKYRFVNHRWMYRIGYDNEEKKFVHKEMPKGYFAFLGKLNLDDEGAFDNGMYSTSLTRYLTEFPGPTADLPDSLSAAKRTELWVKQNYEYRKSLFKGKVRDHQLTVFVKNQLEQVNDNPALLEWLIKDYKATCTTPAYVAIMDRTYAAAKRMMPGQPAPGFTVVDTLNKPVSLASLSGQVVFIDFWATWCAPCRVAMPRVKALEEKFMGRKEVTFLKVNVNDDRQRWKDFLLKERPAGRNLFADEQQSAELRKAYNFDGIPHYVLIGKDGKLIDANAAPDEDAETKIRKALGL
ncbi:MAG: TlpA family protein disulfide reductase [Flavobacteriales bacterium]|nr:TlpA family protein disulfide reductase [Flavobacteriales bacterium]MBP9079056.1 TlpA family protein disulfide reductase [Flavobacteriales bacterium]